MPRSGRGGLDLLDTIDEIRIVCAPGFTSAAAYDDLLSHCENLKDRVAILDGPETVLNGGTTLTRAAIAEPTTKKGKPPADADTAAPPPTLPALGPRLSKGGYGASTSHGSPLGTRSPRKTW